MRIFISSGFILLSLSGILAGYYSYYGAYAAFIKATSNANSHFVSELLANYIKDGTTVLLYMVILLTFHYLFVRFKRRVSATKSITWLTVGVVIFMVFFITPSKYSVDYALFILAIALTFTTISIFELRNSSKECLILSLFFLFLFINPFGSNTGLLKGYSMFVLFPFIYSFINPKSKSFWATILVLLLPLAIFTKFFGIYEDKNIFSLTAVPNHELISPIRTNEIRSDFLNSVGDRIDYFEENNIKVLFYGSKSHIFHYLYPNTSIQSSGFFQPLDNLNYLPHILSEISTDHETVIFLVSSYPEKNGIQGISLLEKELIDRGFKRVQDSSVVILQRMPLKRNPVD